jgi:L-fuconolactonase
LADTSPLVLGVIGRLQPGSASFAADLATLAANPRFRGLRVAAGDLNQPSMALLAERGLVAEVDVAQSAAALLALSEHAQARPDLKIVIDHAGNLPFAGTPSGELADALRQASLAPNVFCKVSRFQEQAGATPAPTEAAPYSPALDFLLETFGEDRLLFGSNWPLSENAGALSDATKVMRSYFAAKPDAVAHKFFRANALAVYGLAPKEL